MHLGRDIWADLPAAPQPTLVKKQLVTDNGDPASVIPTAIEHTSTSVTGMGSTLIKATMPATMTDGLSTTETSASAPPPLSSDPSSSESGISTGAQAGIAFGVLGGIFVIGLIIYLIFSRRRKQAEERKREEDKEKVPDLTDFNTAPPPVLSRDLPSTPVERPAVDKPLPLPVATLDPKARRASTYSNPFDNEFDAVSSLHASDRSLAVRSRSPSPISLDEALPRRPIPTAITTDRVAPLARKASLRQNGPTVAPALSGAFDFEFSSNPFGNGPFGNEHAIGAFVSEDPPTPTDGPVHRVQLDFKPTLEDEMPLKAGQLVRLLHEFDDGWALCSRFDKSEQGVIPRTCLSARPVRPRQESNPGARPGSRPGPDGARR